MADRADERKAQLIVSQILLTLTYRCELHNQSWEEGEGLLLGYNRWVAGAWRGSDRERVAGITGIERL